MIYIFDNTETLIDIITNDGNGDSVILNDNFKRQINKEWSYIFNVNINKMVEKNIKVKNKIGFYDENNNFQLFTIERIEDSFGSNEIKTVICYHDFYNLGNIVIVDKLYTTPATANTVMTYILQYAPYKLGDITDIGTATSKFSFKYISKLEALNEVISTFGLEVSYRLTLNANKTGIAERLVDVKKLGTNTGIRFDFDLNINEIKRTVDTTNLFNVLYGRGKEGEVTDVYGNRRITFADIVWTTPTNPMAKPVGQSYLKDTDSVAKWGQFEGVYDNETIEDKDLLILRTYQKLMESKDPSMTYEVSIIDLAKVVGYEHLKVTLGDTIRIYDTDYDINLEARIIEENYSIFDPSSKEIVLGNYLQRYTSK